jgi:hypothetical protein
MAVDLRSLQHHDPLCESFRADVYTPNCPKQDHVVVICVCDLIREVQERSASRAQMLAFRTDGKREGDLWTIGGDVLPDGTRSANFCCSCEENADGVRTIINAIGGAR